MGRGRGAGLALQLCLPQVLCAPGGSGALSWAELLQSRWLQLRAPGEVAQVSPPIGAERHHKAAERALGCHRAAGTRPRRCDRRKPDRKPSCFNERAMCLGSGEQCATSVPAVGTARAVLGCKPALASFYIL